ncbi:hypothetical protein SNEBB_006567 [Seison nebaliae]|nr:hypothetical protein SNEBB_006567 [Seison nebaliae]
MFALTRDSSVADVVLWLCNERMNHLIDTFRAHLIDGRSFIENNERQWAIVIEDWKDRLNFFIRRNHRGYPRLSLHHEKQLIDRILNYASAAPEYMNGIVHLRCDSINYRMKLSELLDENIFANYSVNNSSIIYCPFCSSKFESNNILQENERVWCNKCTFCLNRNQFLNSTLDNQFINNNHSNNKNNNNNNNNTVTSLNNNNNMMKMNLIEKRSIEKIDKSNRSIQLMNDENNENKDIDENNHSSKNRHISKIHKNLVKRLKRNNQHQNHQNFNVNNRKYFKKKRNSKKSYEQLVFDRAGKLPNWTNYHANMEHLIRLPGTTPREANPVLSSNNNSNGISVSNSSNKVKMNKWMKTLRMHKMLYDEKKRELSEKDTLFRKAGQSKTGNSSDNFIVL